MMSAFSNSNRNNNKNNNKNKKNIKLLEFIFLNRG